MEASFFENVVASASTQNLYDLLDEIQSGRYATKISTLRKTNDEKLKEKIKRNLPSFTPSGVFCTAHRKDDLQSYNPLIILDIDKVGLEKANELKQQVSELNTTFAAFISPSGNGLKILVKTSSTAETHDEVFRNLAAYYESKLGVKIDPSGKDVTRLCIVSYDPELYLNDQSAVWTSTTTAKAPLFTTRNVTSSTTDLFNASVSQTEKKYQYVIGQRNEYLFSLINNLNRYGVSQTEALSFVNSNYPDPDMVGDIQSMFKRVYSNTADHGKYSLDYHSTASHAITATYAMTSQTGKTPVIPSKVYEHLPNFLKKVVGVYDVERERDIALTSVLSLLSGCFNNVTGIYDRCEYHPNLFCFIIAPPASGKGVMNYSLQLIHGIHDLITDTYKKMEAISTDLPHSQRCLLIPADTSAAALKKLIVMNDEKGIICETEADTLSATLQQDWGGYSDLLRKSFHHEPVTFARMSKDQPISYEEIKHPKLSICLSGTPSQVPALLKSTEDGLFSRFMFYSFSNDGVPEFKDVFAKQGVINLSQYFDGLSHLTIEYYNRVNAYGPIAFHLNKHQEDHFLKVFKKRSEKLYNNFGEKTQSTVNRLGLVTFRLAMLLSILRQLDNDSLSSQIECEDVDFESSIQLSEVYLDHALDVYHALDIPSRINPNAERLFTLMPKEFTFSQAVAIGQSASMADRSIANYLKALLQAQYLTKDIVHGKYQKRELQSLHLLQ